MVLVQMFYYKYMHFYRINNCNQINKGNQTNILVQTNYFGTHIWIFTHDVFYILYISIFVMFPENSFEFSGIGVEVSVWWNVLGAP